MRRMEKYKIARLTKRRYVLCFFVCFFILFAGMATVDYSTNQLLNTGRRFSIIVLEKNENFLKLGFMNNYFYVDTRYLNKDFKRLRERLSEKLEIW